MAHQKEPDYLDELIDLSIKQDPEFARVWKEDEDRRELAKLRVTAGLSQAEVAERMKLPKSRVADIERDPARVSFGRVNAYVKAIGAELVIKPGTHKKPGAVHRTLTGKPGRPAEKKP